MMTEQDKKLISDFLADRLSKEEKAEFLKKASTDKAFMKELRREIELNDAIDEKLGLDQQEDD